MANPVLLDRFSTARRWLGIPSKMNRDIEHTVFRYETRISLFCLAHTFGAGFRLNGGFRMPSTWNEGLLPEQEVAASHLGTNARLLAGPGTGKTLALKARIEYLILEAGVEPQHITALTFTRAAAAELRRRVSLTLEGKIADRPNITTLHAFALRNLLHNSAKLSTLPIPVRIVDDWEERNIVWEDLRALTGAEKIRIVEQHFLDLSADWDTLRADDDEENPLRADPAFVGAWMEHRAIFGYTLRSELVYQLRKALQIRSDIELKPSATHLLVDEYQDLNACDLAVMQAVRKGDTELYVAGDDDQSIYGFRHASPVGIRAFDTDNPPSTDLPLGTCFRCDKAIMELARYIAALDPARLAKPWVHRDNAGDGDVRLLRFHNGEEEIQAIASLCRHAIDEWNIPPDEILILVRSDGRGTFSDPLAEAMLSAGVPFATNVGTNSVLDEPEGRMFLAVLRLVVNSADSLALKTFLQLRDNNIGKQKLAAIYEKARGDGISFSAAFKALATDPAGIKALRVEFEHLTELLADAKSILGNIEEVASSNTIMEKLRAFAQRISGLDAEEIDAISNHLESLLRESEHCSVNEVLITVTMGGIVPDQERKAGAVNLLTMHKAKGLSADLVIIMACEDEYLPGRAETGNEEADERRLLYVSVTRARSKLFITYAENRFGRQSHTGRNSGTSTRNLSRYFHTGPLKPTDGNAFVLSVSSPD